MKVFVVCLLYATVALILARQALERATEKAKETEKKVNQNEWRTF